MFHLFTFFQLSSNVPTILSKNVLPKLGPEIGRDHKISITFTTSKTLSSIRDGLINYVPDSVKCIRIGTFDDFVH